MTLNQMVLEVWQMLGEPTDIDPTDGTANPTTGDIDTSSSGYTRIVRALNQGQIAVATHRQLRGRQFRYENAIVHTVVSYTPTDYTVGASGASDYTIYTDLSGSDDDWNEWVVKIGQEVRIVIDSTSGGTLTLGQALDNDYSSGETVTICERPLSLPSNLWTIRKVWDYENARLLHPVVRTQPMMSDVDEGDADAYWRTASSLYLDRVQFDEQQKFGIEYRRFPADMSTSQESEIPDNFHWAFVLWAAGWGYWRQQDPAERKNLRDEFNAFMRERVTEPMIETEAQEMSAGVRID